MRYSIWLFCSCTQIHSKAKNPRLSDMNGEYSEYNLFSLISTPFFYTSKQFYPTDVKGKIAKDKVFPLSYNICFIPPHREKGKGMGWKLLRGGRGELWYIIFILFSFCFHKFSSLSLAFLHTRNEFLSFFLSKEKQRNEGKKLGEREKNIM